MRLFRLASFLPCCLLFSLSFSAQQPATRDPQAIAVLQQSLAAMGGAVPTSTVATGTVRLVEGSTIETGTIRILTRGVDQSAEEILTSGSQRHGIYSRGKANEARGAAVEASSLELSVTSLSSSFPSPLIAAAINNPDAEFLYTAQEVLDGAVVHHIRFWNTFSSQPKLQFLAELSVRDIWIDAASGLPRKLSYDRSDGRGDVPRVPVVVSYSDYRNIGGVLYPFRIDKSLNGTPWMTIDISQAAVNAGLTDSDFPVR